MPNQTTDRGIKFLQSQEGLKLVPYKDPGGLWTIGYGNRISNEEAITFKAGITAQFADELFRNYLATQELAFKNVNLGFHPSTNQYDALMSLIYNIGMNCFVGSTLHILLEQCSPGAISHWMLYDHALGGFVLPGLQKRRGQEVQMFIYGIYPN